MIQVFILRVLINLTKPSQLWHRAIIKTIFKALLERIFKFFLKIICRSYWLSSWLVVSHKVFVLLYGLSFFFNQPVNVQLLLLTVVTALHIEDLIEPVIVKRCFAKLIGHALVKTNFFLKIRVFIASLFHLVEAVFHLPLSIMILKQQVAIANNFASLFNILFPSVFSHRFSLILCIRLIFVLWP